VGESNFYRKSVIIALPPLNPKGQRFHGFNMINLIHHVVKNIMHTGPTFVSRESITSIACIGKEKCKIGQKKVPHEPLKSARDDVTPILGVRGASGFCNEHKSCLA